MTVICDGRYSTLRKLSSNTKKSVTASYVVGIKLRNVHRPYPFYPMVGMGNPWAQTVLYGLDDVTSRLLIVLRNKPRHEELKPFLLTEFTPTLPGEFGTKLPLCIFKTPFSNL